MFCQSGSYDSVETKSLGTDEIGPFKYVRNVLNDC